MGMEWDGNLNKGRKTSFTEGSQGNFERQWKGVVIRENEKKGGGKEGSLGRNMLRRVLRLV